MKLLSIALALVLPAVGAAAEVASSTPTERLGVRVIEVEKTRTGWICLRPIHIVATDALFAFEEVIRPNYNMTHLLSCSATDTDPPATMFTIHQDIPNQGSESFGKLNVLYEGTLGAFQADLKDRSLHRR